MHQPATARAAGAPTPPKPVPDPRLIIAPRKPAVHTTSGVLKGLARVEKCFSPRDAITAEQSVCGPRAFLTASHRRGPAGGAGRRVRTSFKWFMAAALGLTACGAIESGVILKAWEKPWSRPFAFLKLRCRQSARPANTFCTSSLASIAARKATTSSSASALRSAGFAGFLAL